ncbi:hypothetical protein FACS189441_4150 [Betaproteobacteria bacterium]|nr:hypothetical protein FACS189441_4150 [Betaproteobacteria bacterium]
MKSLRHYLPRLLLDLNLSEILHRLIKRLRAPSAIERTRPERTAPRKKGVRIAGIIRHIRGLNRMLKNPAPIMYML